MDIYEHSLKLWEGLSQDLNYNTMYSPRGVMMLSHNVHDQQSFKRHINANRLYGIDNEWLTPEQAKVFVPRSEEHTSELQSLMRNSYAGFCLKKKKNNTHKTKSTKHLIENKQQRKTARI